MDRKDFLKSLGLASGCMLFCSGGLGAAMQEGVPNDQQRKFLERWITSLMNNLEAQFSTEQITALMEACGRDCLQSSSSYQMAESCGGQVEKVVEALAGDLGKENCYMKGNEIFMKLTGKCACPLVGPGPETLPDSYCICSDGFMKEFFSVAAQKPVEVETLQTFKRGGSCCEFIIRIQA
ncbi:MAG TPA: hypothetical protein VMX35_01050 [Acidobacteriota bacterium]|nr:hypothetical protein [Acidobacteriota bacterium]